MWHCRRIARANENQLHTQEAAMASRPITPREPVARLASVNRACAELDISRSFFYSLRRRGLIRTIQLGGKTYVPRSELDRIIEGTDRDRGIQCEAVRDVR
jgi:hypothetical protein